MSCRLVQISTINPTSGNSYLSIFADTEFREGGRLYLNHTFGNPKFNKVKYRGAGVQGNYVNNTGFDGQTFTLLCQYVGVDADYGILQRQDAYAFNGRSCRIEMAITGSTGTVNTILPRCTCEGWSIQSGPKGLVIPNKTGWSRTIVTGTFALNDPLYDVLTGDGY